MRRQFLPGNSKALSAYERNALNKQKRCTMSGISGVSGSYTGLTLTDLLSDVQQNSDSILETSTTESKAQQLLSGVQPSTGRAQKAYGVSATSGVGQAALNRALSEMSTSSDRVTFKDIANYQKELESKFSTNLRLELYKQGVPLDTEFTLSMTADGQIQVQCDDPQAKGIIQKYLQENPEACQDFGYIQALANLERAKQSPTGAAQLMDSVLQSKKEIQLQSVETFFDTALSSGMKYSTLLANFSQTDTAENAADNTSFYAGLDFTV